MAMHKRVKMKNDNIVIGGGDQSKLFEPGYRYSLGDTIYTIIDRFNADNTEMRRMRTAEGTVEDVTVATIIKDHKEANIFVLDPVNIPKPRQD